MRDCGTLNSSSAAKHAALIITAAQLVGQVKHILGIKTSLARLLLQASLKSEARGWRGHINGLVVKVTRIIEIVIINDNKS